MNLAKIKILSLLLFLIFAALSGCATPDRRVDVLYRPAANVKGGSGDLYLVQGVTSTSGQAAGIQWVLGDVRKEDGARLGKVVTDTAPATVVMDALTQELRDAGYKVLVTDKMPDQVNMGLRLTDVSMKVNDVHEVTNDQASSALKMAVEPWRDGKPVSTLRYEADYSNTAVTDRDHLPTETLQKALQLLMSKAVPEIVGTLEKK